MKKSLSSEQLCQYVENQIKNFFPDQSNTSIIFDYIDETIDRVEICFSKINTKYYLTNGVTYFNHLHSGQNSIFLALFANTLFRNNVPLNVCDKLFYLNKILNGIDIFYDIDLPKYFLFGHPLGSVIGKASLDDYFVIYQNCTIGGNYINNLSEPCYPKIGKFFEMYKGSSVIGNCNIGENCKISAHSLLYNMDLENNSIYIGSPDNYIIKKNKKSHKVWMKSYS